MIEDPSAETGQAPQSDAPGEAEARSGASMSEAMEMYQPASFLDALERAGATEPAAVDALRAATTAADAPTPPLSPDHVAEIERLHEATIDAERRAERVLAKPGAQRRLRDALAEEADALHALGFATFDDFAAARSSIPAVEDRSGGSAETIARIAEILTKIGIDQGEDPLEAARAFLTTHESDPVVAPTEDDRVVAAPSETWASPPAPAPSLPEPAAALPEANPTVEDEELRRETAAAAALPEANPTVEDAWVSAARLPAAEPSPPEPSDGADDVLDRWISAEARAERMHAEVDRAQAELVAMLARSAELEQTAVVRADERDTAHAELEGARERVAELEQSIARSGAERDEIERALTTSRGRIAELEGIVADREQACAEAARDRATALATVADLEMHSAARTAELEQARTTVDELEAELTTLTANLDQTRDELGTARVNVDELRTELETTRRSLDALDEHAEAIEAELAEARRKADSPETRRELEAVREELTAARTELGELEARRTETETTLGRHRAELQQLQHELTTTRDATNNARNDLSAARNAFEATSAHVEAAERARAAITIDAADLLARAEAEAANLLERANRDAEAIRQEAQLESGKPRPADGDPTAKLAAQVAKLERKLDKQRRRLDRITNGPQEPVPEAIAEQSAADREASEIRRAVRRDRERFRDELVDLLNRLAPLDEDD